MDAMAVKGLGARWVVVLTGCLLTVCASLPAHAAPPSTTALPLRKLDLSRLPVPDSGGADAADPSSGSDWYRPAALMPASMPAPSAGVPTTPDIYYVDDYAPSAYSPPTASARVVAPPSGPGLWRDAVPVSAASTTMLLPPSQMAPQAQPLPLPEAFQPAPPSLMTIEPTPVRQSVVLAPQTPRSLPLPESLRSPSAPARSTAYEPAEPEVAAMSLPMPSVLQAPPASGPTLMMDTHASPAWKSAVIPPDSKGEAVGRVPPAAAAVGFTIGAGDTVQVDVLGRPELSAKGNVSGDGRVTVALVGPINIGGLTPVQAAERIADAYRQGEYLLSPQVTVTMIDYQSQLLTVLGEVRSPGRFPMRTRLSVLDGLALAGGISDQGASMAYLLRPEGSVVTRYEIDLDALIQAGAGQQYFEMLAGDTLVVPKTQVFYIYGEAKNPNAYKLKPGMTVIQALSLAGGLTDKGSDKRIDIRRRDGDGQLRTLTASLNEPLLPDDVVYIRERLF